MLVLAGTGANQGCTQQNSGLSFHPHPSIRLIENDRDDLELPGQSTVIRYCGVLTQGALSTSSLGKAPESSNVPTFCCFSGRLSERGRD